jgi:uncharacterized protein (DUF362 family)
MEHFVNIKTLFVKRDERNTERLALIYKDHDRLKKTITEVSGKWLDKELIEGKRVLLKPNWVKHNNLPDDDICLRTNDGFLIAALEVILTKKPKQVVIGDAPLQGCYWEKMIKDSLVSNVNDLSKKYAIPIEIKDYRRRTFDPSQNNPLRELNPIEDYLIFDVGADSYLEPLSIKNKNPFRVTYYNPDKLSETHKPGVHKYCITKEIFNADVIISLPKVKTHQKAGITAALKNIVGVNGDKDYLPHHRLGGTGFGGDCYPGGNYLRYVAELIRDKANRNQGNWKYPFFYKLSSLIWRLSWPGKEHYLSASWYGNDTTWRMVLDLNIIAEYGTPDGKIAKEPQRVLYSLCDGIIGGQGDGPLKPIPLPLGVVSFTNHSGMNDVCIGRLMGFDTNRIPLLINALSITRNTKVNIILNGKEENLDALSFLSVKTIPPPGWEKHLK